MLSNKTIFLDLRFFFNYSFSEEKKKLKRKDIPKTT